MTYSTDDLNWLDTELGDARVISISPIDSETITPGELKEALSTASTVQRLVEAMVLSYGGETRSKSSIYYLSNDGVQTLKKFRQIKARG